MRRKDREVTDFSEMLEIVKKCDVCRIAFNNDEYPYILPLNFGHRVIDGNLVLYFHGAAQGTKYEVMEKDNRVSFEMDCQHELFSKEEIGYCTMYYLSVIGQGTITEVVDNDEKMEALNAICDQYHKEHFNFNAAPMMRTKCLKLVVNHWTAKANVKKV